MSLIIAITGMSGSGKSTLEKGLTQRLNAKILKSITTRPKRAEDIDEYSYISKEEFEIKIANNEFLTWRQDSQGNFYGMPFDIIKEALAKNEISVRSINPGFITQWHEALGNKVIFLHIASPGNKKLEHRLSEREEMDTETIKRRMEDEKNWEHVVAEFIASGIRIHLLPNQTVEETLDYALKIIELECSKQAN